MRDIWLRAIRLVPITALALLTAAPSAQTAAATLPRASELPLSFRGDRAIDQRPNDGLGSARVGAWNVLRSGLKPNGDLWMTVRMEPPATGFAGRSGPAVLFARLSLFGGVGGDVGFEAQAAPIASVDLPACKIEAACSYVGRIVLPTAGLTRAARRTRFLESPIAEVGFSLVRSFGQGRWLQVMPMFGTSQSRATLARPGTGSGTIDSMGIFPAERAVVSRFPNEHPVDFVAAVRSARQALGDPSTPIGTVAARVDLTLHGCNLYWMVAIHDADGNLPYLLQATGLDQISQRITVPDDRTWTLTSQGEEGIFEFTPGPDGAGMDVGSFVTSGHDLAITADLTCGLGPTGSLSVAPADLPPVPLPPTDTANEATLTAAQPSADAALLVSVAAFGAGAWLLTSRRRRAAPNPSSASNRLR